MYSEANTTIMKIVKLFGLLISLCMYTSSCQKEENQFIIMNEQINELIKQAEIEMDTLHTFLDPFESKICLPQNGLSINYLVGAQNLYFNPNNTLKENNDLAKNSILSKFPWGDLTPSQKDKIQNVFQHYENQQCPSIKIAAESMSLMNKNFENTILELQQKLESKIITQSQYDKIMTDIQDTFFMNIRSIYEEQKVYITCCNNYRNLLEEIQKILTMKQWEEFFSCVYKK